MIRRKTCASRKTDWQLCTSIYRPLGSCHCAQQLLANSLSFYLRMYICKSQVSKVPHVAQLPLCTKRQYLWAIEEWEANFFTNSTAFAWQLMRLAILGLCSEETSTAKGIANTVARLWGWNPRLHGVPGCRIDTKSKKNVFTHLSGHQKSPCLHMCYTNNRIIFSFLRVRTN